MHTLNANDLTYPTATMTSSTRMILTNRSPNSTLDRGEPTSKSIAFNLPKVELIRDIPISQFVIGGLCFIFEIIGLISPASRSLLGPGVFCGFFLLQVSAFGVLTYFYDIPYFPTIAFAGNVLAAVASLIGLSLCSAAINEAKIDPISNGESLFVATRCLILICCIVGGLFSVILAVLFFKKNQILESSWQSQTTSDTMEMDKLKTHEFHDCSVDGGNSSQNNNNHASISDISNISYIDQNHSRTPSGSYQGTVYGAPIYL